MAEGAAAVLILLHVNGVAGASAHADGQRDALAALGIGKRIVAEPFVQAAVAIVVVAAVADGFARVADGFPALVELALAADDELVFADRGARRAGGTGKGRGSEAIGLCERVEVHFGAGKVP